MSKFLSDLVDLVMENDLAAEQVHDLQYSEIEFCEASDRVNESAQSLRTLLENHLGKKLERVLSEDLEIRKEAA